VGGHGDNSCAVRACGHIGGQSGVRAPGEGQGIQTGRAPEITTFSRGDNSQGRSGLDVGRQQPLLHLQESHQ